MTVCKVDLQRTVTAAASGTPSSDPLEAYLRTASQGTERLGCRAESGRWLPVPDPNLSSERGAEKYLEARRRYDGLRTDVGNAFRSVPEGARWRIRILVDRSRDADEDTYAALCAAAAAFYQALSHRRGFSVRISVYPGLVSTDFVTGRDRLCYDAVLPHAGNAAADANLAAIRQTDRRAPLEAVLAALISETAREPADERILVTFAASAKNVRGETLAAAARALGLRTAMLTAGTDEPFGDVTVRWTDGSFRTAVRTLAAGLVARCGPEEAPLGRTSASPGKANPAPADASAGEKPSGNPKRIRRGESPQKTPPQEAKSRRGAPESSTKGNCSPGAPAKSAPAEPDALSGEVPLRTKPVPSAPGADRDPASRSVSLAAWQTAWPMRAAADRILDKHTDAYRALGSLRIRILLDASRVWAGPHRALSHARLRILALSVRDWLEECVCANVDFALTPGTVGLPAISLDFAEEAERHRIGVLAALTPGGTEAVGRALSDAVGRLEKESADVRAVLLFTAGRFDGRSAAPHFRDFADKGIRLGVFAFDGNPLACGDTFTGCAKEADLLPALDVFIRNLAAGDRRHTAFGPHRFLRNA